jgi:hypothetical protein
MSLSLLVAITLSAQPVELTKEPAPSDGPALTVRGVAVGPEGRPLTGASVYLRAKIGGQFYSMGLDHNRDVLARTTTDERGSFAFNRIAIPPRLGEPIERLIRGEGGAEIVAVAPGHSIVWMDVLGLKPAAPLKLVLPPQAEVKGRVTGENGEALAGVQIRLAGLTKATSDIDSFFHAPGDLSFSLSQIQVSTHSDNDGTFALPNVPHDYRVSATFEKEGHRRDFIVLDSGAPGGPEEVRFRGGGGAVKPLLRSPLEIKLAPQPDLVVRVVDHLGEPVTTGAIQFIDSQRHSAGWSAVNERGEARLARSAAGPFTAIFSGDPLSPRLGSTLLAELAGGQATPIELKLPEQHWLSGRVVDADTGAGICGAYLHYILPGGNREAPSASANSSAVSGQDGTFRIPVAVGKGRITFLHDVYGYLAPTRGAVADRNGAPPAHEVEVAEGGGVTPLTVKLSRGLVVRGRLDDTDRKPAVGILVRAQNRDLPYISRSALTDAEGRFELRGLSPQVATLVAASAASGSCHAEIAAEPDQPWDRTRIVDLPPLELREGVKLAGRVVFEGQGRAGVRLKLMRSIGSEKNTYHPCGDVITDADGKFQVAGLDPGDRFQFEIVDPDGLAAPDWKYQGGYVQHVPAGKAVVTLSDAVLTRRGQRLRGIVVDPQGQPVAGISVSARLTTGGMLMRRGDEPPPWTQTTASGRFELTNLPDQPIELMAYRANPKGGVIRFPARVRPTKGQQDIRILLDPELTSDIEDLDAPRK